MTLIKALEKAEHGQTISRKYQILNGMTFSKHCKAEVVKVGRFLKIEWGGKIKLDDLKADNWELIQLNIND